MKRRTGHRSLWSRIRRLAGACTVGLALLLLGVGAVQAATPRVMLSDYAVEEDAIVAGEAFTLHLTLKNTASGAIRNLKLTISTEQGEFLPTEGAGTAYLDKLAGGGESEFTFAMTAAEGLTAKSYKLLVKTEYEGSDGSPYTVEESVFLPVTLEQRCSVTDVFITESNIELGDTVEVSASVNNLGDAPLYNVTASVSGDNLQAADTYIGTVEAGKKGNVDLLTRASKVSEITGDKNQIQITYEDRTGKRSTITADIALTVAQPVYENLETVKADTSAEQGWRAAAISLLAMIVVGGITALIVRRRKRKKKLLEEF